jgi:(1->4)-alpha-D-glucan 1-alpha-D-glucosylmutase
VLSEIPDAWAEQVKQWADINFSKKERLGGRTIPDRNDEYFLYQTLVGSFPFDEAEFPAFVDRLKDYLIKQSARQRFILPGYVLIASMKMSLLPLQKSY